MGETVYLVLRDEHNNLVRVPSHTMPTMHHSRTSPARLTDLLLQCEGIVAKSDNGDERRIDAPGQAWLQTCSQQEAEQKMDWELRAQRMRL